MKTREEIVAETEEEFARLQQELSQAAPGVAEVLELYGQAEAAVRQAEEFLAAATPVITHATTTDSSSPAL